MGLSERQVLINNIENKRNSLVLTYITSTRPNLEVQMAMDCIRKIYDHIKNNSDKKDIDLYLMSNGGDGTVPWRLVTLIREYTNKFSVIIPYRAFSAATLTALGADEIVMHPMGMLGPTDPTVGNPFNPIDAQGRPLGISVEDVTAYLALIKEDAGIRHEDELVLAFNHLADKVHPLALGNVKRSLSQSRMMAAKLLQQSMSEHKDNHKIEEIVDNLTSKLYFHGHPINRKEARTQVGLNNITNPDNEFENLIWELYLDYESEMLLEQPFDPVTEFLLHSPNTSAITEEKEAKLAFIETKEMTDYLSAMYQLIGTKMPDGSVQVQVTWHGNSWKHLP
ncbi:MAG: hypothetical protein FWG99_08130 [Treponema sp.]|nr:hypothetical protein [Treponema sp.]